MNRPVLVPARFLAALALGAATLGLVAPAAASRSFPAAVQAAAGMPCTPTCRLCHVDDQGGPGRLRTGGFGQYLVNTCDLVQGQSSTVAPAIACAGATVPASDLDGDGISDIEELKVGADPNGGAAWCGDGASEAIEYGCGGGSRIAHGDRVDGLALFTSGAALALGAALLRRRAAGSRR